MKTKLTITIIFLFISSTLYIGCKKYEEGPAMSLRTKKGRVANKWKVDAYLKNGTDMISDYRMATASELFEMTKDGNYTTTVTYTPAFGGGTYTDNGTWEFINDKVDIKTTSSVSSTNVDTIHITRLKNKEMWHSFMLGSDKYEVQMVPAE